MAGTPSPGSERMRADQGGNETPPRNRKSGAGNPPPTAGTRRAPGISPRLQRIAELARRSPGTAFTSLAHHIDLDWLREAHARTRKDAAPGVDGQSAQDYEADLEANLRSLLNRAKSGTYRAPAVRRVHLPKEEGAGSRAGTRPIGITTFEDKVLQRAIQMVLEAIYEQDFLDGSYGFRPRRSAHQALGRLRREVMRMGGCWLFEVDIQSCFDSLDHGWLREILRRRVRDGVLLRLIGKWLQAGVMEDGALSYPDCGTPQGGVISPLLANVYLHEVLDVWWEREIRPQLHGAAFLIRYADDFVLGFANEADARRVMGLLAERFAEHGLRLHPTKTRLVDFRHPARRRDRSGPDDTGARGPGSFDLLGFTHFWGRAWKGGTHKGGWIVKRRTAKKRLTRALNEMRAWCRRERHLELSEQHQMLVKKIRGHYNYYAITNNWRCLVGFLRSVERIWHTWLSRRSRAGYIPWARMRGILQRYPLPAPAIQHRI